MNKILEQTQEPVEDRLYECTQHVLFAGKPSRWDGKGNVIRYDRTGRARLMTFLLPRR